MKILKDIKLGADPELFVKNVKTGMFVPSLDLIGGSKMFPRQTSLEGFFVQEDNVLVEFNIPASETKEMFRENIRQGIRIFEEFLPRDQYSVEIATSHKFTPEQLADPRAQEFGCTPDHNAWNEGRVNPTPMPPMDGMRCAGGHIHFGYNFNEGASEIIKAAGVERESINMHVVRWMDLLLGVPSIMIDKDKERRRIYGKAGSFRNKPYGGEYRTLSSFWLSSNSLIDWAFDKTQEALDNVSNMKLLDNKVSERIRAAINLQDRSAIDSLFDEYKLAVA